MLDIETSCDNVGTSSGNQPQRSYKMTASIVDYIGRYLPNEDSDKLHDVSDVIAFMASQGLQAADSSTSTSTQADTNCGLTVCVNGYVYRKFL